MKYLVKIYLYALFLFSFYYSCFKPDFEAHTIDHVNNNVVFRYSSDTIESLDWNGDIERDCEGPGTKCVVIRPKGAKIAVDFMNVVNTMDYLMFFQSPEGSSIPLSQEVKSKIISGELMVYPKERSSADEMQFRIK